MISKLKLFNFFKNNSIFFIVLCCITAIFWLFFFTYLAVPFFKLLCQDTGPNGLYGLVLDLKKRSPIFSVIIDQFILLKNNIFWFNFWSSETNSIADGDLDLKKLRFVDMTVIFKINDRLPLSFNSSTLKHHISVGSPQLIFCTVKNESLIDVVFTSIYNVYPAEALPHIEKIQCFCYDDQLVEANSSLYLPVYYRLSSNFCEDPLMSNVSNITISYSIFKS